MFVTNAADWAWLEQAQLHSQRHWLENADLDISSLALGDTSQVPLMRLRETRQDDSYVANLRSAWLRYPLEEACRYLPSWSAPATKPAGLLAGGLISSTRLERATLLGNFLVSTNLYPELRAAELVELIPRAIDTSPKAPLAVRSVCPAANPMLANSLDQLGFQRVVARKVYLCDPSSPSLWRRNHVRKDQKLLDDPSVEVVHAQSLTLADLPYLHRIFRMLFIGKHSPLNPDYSLAFFAFCLSSGFLELFALRYAGQWVGVLGIYARHGWLTTPLIGYDTSLPQSLGLYRRLMALLYRQAKEQQVQLHLSSGADSFKIARGGVEHLEYTAVHSLHLPMIPRTANQIFAATVNRFAPRVLSTVK